MLTVTTWYIRWHTRLSLTYIIHSCLSMYHHHWLTHWDMAPTSCVKRGKGEEGSHSPGWTVVGTCVLTVWTTWHGVDSQVIAVTCHPFSWWCGIAWLSLLLASAVLVQGVQQQLWKVVIVGLGVNRVWFSICWLPCHCCGPCLLYEERRGCGGGIKLHTWTNVDGDDDCVVTVWMTWHIHWHARSLPSAVGLLTWHCHIVAVVGMCDGGSGCQMAVVTEGLLAPVVGGCHCGWWWLRSKVFVCW